MLLLAAVVDLVLFSGTTAFATAYYSGHFWDGYTTSGSVTVTNNGYIYMSIQKAQFCVNNMWHDGAVFKTTALCTGSGSFDQTSWYNNGETTHTFDWTGIGGAGRLQFLNDYSPYSLWYLWNKGSFY